MLLLLQSSLKDLFFPRIILLLQTAGAKIWYYFCIIVKAFSCGKQKKNFIWFHSLTNFFLLHLRFSVISGVGVKKCHKFEFGLSCENLEILNVHRSIRWKSLNFKRFFDSIVRTKPLPVMQYLIGTKISFLDNCTHAHSMDRKLKIIAMQMLSSFVLPKLLA